jgi:uncharacterized small protein (DUF1192 family)
MWRRCPAAVAATYQAWPDRRSDIAGGQASPHDRSGLALGAPRGFAAARRWYSRADIERLRSGRKHKMSNDASLSLAELDRRIAIVRDNIRQLIEQAAAFSGAEDEDRNAARIAQQNEELERLVKERDALLQKQK